MINLSKKLYISLFSLLLLVVVAGTATFAWFKLNTNAWFDDLELKANAENGIKISVDGKNFKSNLTEEDLKVAILAKVYGYSVGYIDGEIYYTKMNSKGTLEYLPVGNYKEDFERIIVLEPLTSNNGHTFKDLYGRSKGLDTGEYVNLDIYFKGDDNSARTVYFSNSEKYYDDYVVPKTEIVVKDEETISFPNNLSGSFSTYNPQTGEIFKYEKSLNNQPEFEFRTLASNAARFSVRATSGEVVEENYRIYEINEGIGSYATDFNENYYVGASGAKYDAKKNAAFTYYNNVRGFETGQYIEEISFEDVPNTFKAFDTVEGATVVRLDESNDYGQTGKAKINMNIWIEGWDADCIDSIWDQSIQVKFAFTGFEIQEEPIELTYRVTHPETGETVSERTVHQIQGEKISEKGPVKDIYSSVAHKFKCWGQLLEDGSVVPYDFDQTALLDRNEAPSWIFVTIWEN